MTANPEMDAAVAQFMEKLLEALEMPSVTKETIAEAMTKALYKTLTSYQKLVIEECSGQYQTRLNEVVAGKDRLIAEVRAERDIANTISVKTQTELITLRQKVKAPRQRQKMATGRGRRRA